MTDTVRTPSLQITRTMSAPVEMPDVDRMAEQIIQQALSFCVEKLNAAGSEMALARIRSNDLAACDYYLYGLTKHVAASLGALDEHAKAAYTLEYEAVPSDACFAESGTDAVLVHLIVWTERKTAAFHALVGVLDKALARALAARFDRAPQQSVLDVQVIDDQDVANRTNYGALFRAIHHRPLQVWER